MYNTDPIDGDPFRLLANCFRVVETLFVFCKNLAVFIFPTLLAYFEDPIQNRVPALWVKLF